MKKQTNLPAGSRKLSLNKKTISNLQHSEMSKKIGGTAPIYGCGHYHTKNCSQNQNTCTGHKTC